MAKTNNTTANLGFEEKLWAAADELRGCMDSAESKHVLLGLIFLKYISDAFASRCEEREVELSDLDNPFYIKEPKGRYEGMEDRGEHIAKNVFWVPSEARWEKLVGKAKYSNIGKLIDAAMVAIECENPRLKGVLPKRFARPNLDKTRLGELLDLIGTDCSED